MAASLFMLWHASVRSRLQGIRADYCPGCLCITKHRVTLVEKAHHVLHVSLGYREVARFTECPLCGTASAISPDAPMLSAEGASETTIDDLIEATNAGLTPQRVREIQDRDEWSSAELREAHVLRRFCLNQIMEFDLAGKNLSGWTPLVVLLSLALALCVMSYVGPLAGLVAGVALLTVALRVRRKMIDAAAAKKIVPRVRLLLRAIGRDIEYLRDWLSRAAGPFVRHEKLRKCADRLGVKPRGHLVERFVR